MAVKKTWFIVLATALLSGCATYYPVRVNDYLDRAHGITSIPFGSSFYVLENKNESNPILEAEIRSKIATLLREKGSRTESYDKADFLLSFAYSISSGRSVSEIRPQFSPGEIGTVQTYKSNGRTSTSIVTMPGYTTYVPYRITVYTSTLTLEILDAYNLRVNNEKKILWIGENSSTSQNPDLRDTINYLLVASFEHFGKNTGKSLVTNIPENDPRVKRIRQGGESQ